MRLRYILLPQLAPFLIVAARNGLALVWKIVLVAELMGRSSGVGFQLQTYFQVFEVPHIPAYAIAFMLVVVGIDSALLAPIERRTAEWRR